METNDIFNLAHEFFKKEIGIEWIISAYENEDCYFFVSGEDMFSDIMISISKKSRDIDVVDVFASNYLDIAKEIEEIEIPYKYKRLQTDDVNEQ